MKIIGIRKMAVIMWCAMMITIVMVYYVKHDKLLKTTDIMGITAIAGLGGFHTLRQGKADAINKLEAKTS